MGIVKYQSKYSTIYFTLGVGLGYLNMGLLGPILLTKSELGVFNFVISTSVLIASLTRFGVPSILIRFFPIFNKEDRGKAFLNTVSLLTIGTLIICALALLLLPYLSTPEFSRKFNDNVLHISVISLSFIAFQNLYSYAQSLHKPLLGVFLKEVLVRLLILGLLVLIYFELILFKNILMGLSLAYFTIFLILFFRFGSLKFSFDPRIKGKSLKELLNYSVFATLSNSSGILVSSLDKIMIATMVSYESTAIYSVAFMVGAVVTLPQRIISTPITPLMSKLMAHKDYDEVKSLSNKSSIMMTVLTCLLLMIILNSLDYFYDLLPGGYEDGFTVVLLIGLANLMGNLALPLVHIITNSKLYRLDLYTNLVLIILIIVSNYIGIKTFGIVGAAGATLVSMLIYHSIRGIIVFRTFDFNLINKKLIIAVAIAGFLFLLPPYLFSELGYYTYFVVSNTFLALSYSLLIYVLKISDDFNETIESTWKKIFK